MRNARAAGLLVEELRRFCVIARRSVEPDGRQQLARLPLHCYHPRELHHLLGLLASQARLRVERAEERGRVGSELWADELGNALTVHNIFRKDLKEPSTVD